MFALLGGKLKAFFLAGIGILAIVATALWGLLQQERKKAVQRKLVREKQAGKVKDAVIQADIDADKRETEIDEKYKTNTDRFDIK